MQTYTVLSPWSEVDTASYIGLSPRPDTLNGKTVGMFGDFMNAAVYMLQAVEQEILKQYPECRFSYLQYKAETTRIPEDEAFLPEFERWIQGVDCVLCFYGAVPSSSLFLGYNAAYMEQRGKPVVMAVTPRTYSTAIRGCKALGVPGLRTIQFVSPTDIFGHADASSVIASMQPIVEKVTGELLDGLLRPLSGEEAAVPAPDQSCAKRTYTGTEREINRIFYRNGWTNGTPIEMPTREAVDEMLRGTDLPADYVVGKIPPKMGCATVEKIAVNAVMAGCLPIHLPVLIAAVRGVLDKRVRLEGWSCSQSTWGPVLTLSGPIVNEIGLNTGTNHLSPYYKANAAIARAFSYLLMNIGGLRPGVEDLSECGHENRLGLCIGDSLGENPWGPLHTDYGIAPEDSALTLFWPQEHRVFVGHSTQEFLTKMCTVDPYGWEPGAMVILTPLCAKKFAEEGWGRRQILNYMVEYDRRPASKVDLKWLKNNSHPPKTVDLPVNPEHSTRVFWSDEHMLLLVGGGHAGMMATVLGGGGDHGGPSCTKIELPANWAQLVEEYREYTMPEYIDY